MEDMCKLVRKILDGDKEAFKEVVKAYGPSMRVYLSGKLSDRLAVDDLMQEIFVAIFWNLKTFDGKSDLGVWIRAVTRNKLMSYLRSHYSQKNSVNTMKVKIEEALTAEMDNFNPNENAVIEKLKECISKQRELAADLIKARYFENESVTGMAERMNTTVSAISSELYRVRKQLKMCIEKGSEL
ncbi:MAG: sigma-70 family RNA polymerase sigma factor [Lentisphaeraceae bacterium]|nr:sigma-70 family RNA polymerase sigma factor [Lentisphaeraceae bacterium]